MYLGAVFYSPLALVVENNVSQRSRMEMDSRGGLAVSLITLLRKHDDRFRYLYSCFWRCEILGNLLSALTHKIKCTGIHNTDLQSDTTLTAR